MSAASPLATDSDPQDWDEEAFSDRMRDAFAQALLGIGRVNIALFGRTGAGKSTLINTVFGDQVAKTGIGRPVTEGMNYYEHPKGILGLYDSEGFELGASSKVLVEKLTEIVRESRKSKIEDQIHAVWYCVRADDRRFEDSQADFVRALANMGLPVMIVFTQVEYDRDNRPKEDARKLKEYVLSLNLPLRPKNEVYLTNAAEESNSRNPTPVHGVKQLLDATFLVVPEGVAQALTASQHYDEQRKEEASRNIIKEMSAAATAAAVLPIPLSDSALIMPIQIIMMARIATSWDLPVDGSALTGLATRALFAQGIGQLAKSVVRGLLSWVPGIGAAVTVAKAGVAGTMTWAVGEAWLLVCGKLSDKDSASILGSVKSDEITDLFMQAYKNNAKRKR